MDFVDEEFIFVDLICRESIDDEGLEIPVRSLLLFVDVCDWVVLGLYGNIDDGAALLLVVGGLTGSFEDCFCCWVVLGIWEVFEDEIRGFLVNDDDGIVFGSVLIGTDFVSGGFFFSSFVEGGRVVFLTDWFTVAFVDWVLGLVIGIVIVNLDCLVSFVDDEIGFVVVEIFLISVFVGDDIVLIFLGIVDEEIVDFFDVVEGRIFVFVLL